MFLNAVLTDCFSLIMYWYSDQNRNLPITLFIVAVQMIQLFTSGLITSNKKMPVLVGGF